MEQWQLALVLVAIGFIILFIIPNIRADADSEGVQTDFEPENQKAFERFNRYSDELWEEEEKLENWKAVIAVVAALLACLGIGLLVLSFVQ